MEREQSNEQVDLQALQELLDSALAFDQKAQRRMFGTDLIFAWEKGGIYEVNFGQSRQLVLEFSHANGELKVLNARIEWSEGHFDDTEYDPILLWRMNKQFEEVRRQRTEGNKSIRVSNGRGYTVCEEAIEGDQLPGFVKKLHQCVSEELRSHYAEDAEHYRERKIGWLSTGSILGEDIEDE